MKKHEFSHVIVSKRIIKIVFSAVIVIALLVLIGWFSGLLFLTRLSNNEVPMAPSTAYLFICLVVGLWFYHRPQKIAINRKVSTFSGVIVICLSCFIVITNIFEYYLNWEHAFIKIPETQLSVQLGHMSLVTAILFIICGIAFLLLRSKRKIFKTFSLLLTLIVFIVSFTLLLGYGFGDPFFYFGSFIPPAVLTVLSFLLISLGLIAAFDKKTFFIKTLWGTSTSAKLLRVFLPTIIVINIVESLIVFRILPLLKIHPAISSLLVNVIFVAIVIVVILNISKSLGQSLDSALGDLSESEERFRKISENAPVLINSFDEKGRCLFWNEQCRKIFGWTMKEINEHEVAMSLFYPDPIVCEEVIRTVTNDPEGSFREWHPVTKNGKILSIMWANFRLPSGQVFSMGHDITARKSVEKNLLENQRRYKKAQAMGHVGNWEYDPLTTVFWASDEAKRIYGLEKVAKNFTTETVENCIPERELVHQALVDLVKHSKKYDLVFDILTADKGIRKTIHSIAEIDRDVQGNPIKIIGVINDITQSKQDEQVVKESEERLNLIINASPVGICTVDPLGNFLMTNQAYEQMLGYSKEELVGLSFFDVTHPDDRPKNKKLFQSMFSLKATGFSMNKKYIRKDGFVIDVSVHAVGVKDSEGNIGFGTAFVDDITERKRSEEKEKIHHSNIDLLSKTAMKFIEFTEGSNIYDFVGEHVREFAGKDSFVIVNSVDWETGTSTIHSLLGASKYKKAIIDKLGMDPVGMKFNVKDPNVHYQDGKLHVYNDGLYGLLLNTVPKIICKSIEKLTKIKKIYVIDLAKKEKFFGSVIILLKGKAGKLKNKQVIETFLKQASIAILKNQAEKALRGSEAKLNALFTSLTEMVVVHELVLNEKGEAINYRIIDCNKAFTKATGIRKEDAIGKLASEVYQSDPPPYLEKFAEVGLGGKALEFTDYYAPFDKHLMISVVSPQPGKFATITTDVSNMMRIQEMIMAKNKEMENYLYVTSHDLRTPLVNIQGFSQRLKKQTDLIKNLFVDKNLEPEILNQLGNITDEGIPKTLGFILSNIEKMDNLINGLLKLSRTGRVEMNIKKVDMNKVLAQIFRRLDFQIKEALCEISIDSLPVCYGDVALLDQLFANIISNALKYSDSERALKITVSAKKKYNRVVYTIRDTGKGIAQKYQEKIWDVFYRTDPRSEKAGEGIGLSLVKQIVEKHKGKVWVESEENKGTVFFIELHSSLFTEL